jgi:copper transport protein
VKVVLFCALLAVGNLSRRVIAKRLTMRVAYAHTDVAAEAEPRLSHVDHERMRRAVLLEVVLAALVLAATAVLVDQPRGREALAAKDREPVSASAPLGSGRSVTVTLDPGVHGPVIAEVALTPGTRPTKVTATATQPQKQLGPIPIPLTANGTDLWGSSSVNLPVSGTWVISLVVTTSAFDATTVTVKIPLH